MARLGKEPFVLLEFDRARSCLPRLFTHMACAVIAERMSDVLPALERARALSRSGHYLAGYIGYEAGFALDPALAILAEDTAANGPLMWLGAFRQMTRPSATEVMQMLPDNPVSFGVPQPHIAREVYIQSVKSILERIRAGDIYQANMTFQADVAVNGSPLAAYAALRRGGAGWGGMVATGDAWLLSASPELFFTLDAEMLTARPMKGTAPRVGGDDDAERARLRSDPKERAENLMIVDLLRNDLSRVACAGSVQVPTLFEIETYPTLHQMTSTVTGRMLPGLHTVDVLSTLFPCGSVTGAPKLKAMEIIDGAESGARGAYTGSLGWFDGKDAAFNVLIRSLLLKDRQPMATIGLGSGIVADSNPVAEWEECLLKARFLRLA